MNEGDKVMEMTFHATLSMEVSPDITSCRINQKLIDMLHITYTMQAQRSEI